MKKMIILVLAMLSALYLINPGFGVLELIPDNIPFVGNVDEGLAAYVLYSAIEYFRGNKIGMFK